MNIPAKQPKPYNPIEEPSELLKTAVEQVSGVGNVEQSQPPQSLESPKDFDPEREQRERNHLMALQNELRDVIRRQEREKEDKKLQEARIEEQRKEQEEQKPPIESSSKPKRGILGGMRLFGIGKKQRQTEFVKSPTG